jgi:phosphoribosyl-ATP pyrophosphohydrolase/phosphoribosyl-AMP cyclohydrolase
VNLSELKFDSAGLIPAVIQSDTDNRVLMVGYMTAETVQLTLNTRQTHFYSRSRSEIWHKGKTSGSVQEVVSLSVDCDGDALLVIVRELGPACHTGERSCFDNFSALEAE